MKGKKAVWIVSFCCIGAGIALLAAGLAMGGRPGFYIDSTGVHTLRENGSSKPHVQEKMKLDAFTSMNVDMDYADLNIIPSDGYYIEYQLDGGNPKPVLEVNAQKLRFKEGAPNGFMGFYFFSAGGIVTTPHDYYVNLYVPAEQYFSSVNLKNDDGRIGLERICADSLDIQNDYGSVQITRFEGGTFKGYMGNGNCRIEELAADKVEIDNDYGDCYIGTGKCENLEIKLGNGDFRTNDLKAEQVSISNDYGSCYLGRADYKNLKAELGNGSFTMDKGQGSGIDVDNEYGTVNLGLAGPLKAYKLDLATEYGVIKVPGFPEVTFGKDDTISFKYTENGDNEVKVRCGSGDIVIEVKE